MNFSESKLPSSTRELESYWAQCVRENFNFSRINIHGKETNFNLPVDYFDMSDVVGAVALSPNKSKTGRP